MNMKKAPTVLNFTLKAFEIFSASKQKLYIRIEKELRLLVTKNRDFSPFR